MALWLFRCSKICSRVSQPRNYQTTHSTRQRVFFVPVSHTHRIMVAQVGQLSGWPVSFGTGVENPVWATTS
ncbi:ash family protein [Salmonella enterica]|nr:ash family protein [Salmonella enterica]